MASHNTGPVSSSRSGKVAERLRKRIEDGEYYEALQTYKALYSRYRAQGREQEAVDLVYEGAATLLENSQWECGTDLALTVINFHKEKNSPITDTTLESISRLFHLYSLPPQTATGADSISMRLIDLVDINPRELFVRAALKWSSVVGDEATCKYGHPQIHQTIAKQYWKEKQYPMSGDHFLYAEDPESFADMLIEFSTQYGYPAERNFFIVRAVLQLLVLNKARTALLAYHHYITTHPHLTYISKKSPPFEGEPALNLAWFLLHSAVYLKEFTVDILEWIRRNYSAVIERDPSFPEYMDKIGVVYCGVTPEKKPEGGLEGIFDSFMSSMAPPTGPPQAVDITDPPPTKTAALDSDDVLD